MCRISPDLVQRRAASCHDVHPPAGDPDRRRAHARIASRPVTRSVRSSTASRTPWLVQVDPHGRAGPGQPLRSGAQLRRRRCLAGMRIDAGQRAGAEVAGDQIAVGGGDEPRFAAERVARPDLSGGETRVSLPACCRTTQIDPNAAARPFGLAGDGNSPNHFPLAGRRRRPSGAEKRHPQQVAGGDDAQGRAANVYRSVTFAVAGSRPDDRAVLGRYRPDLPAQHRQPDRAGNGEVTRRRCGGRPTTKPAAMTGRSRGAPPTCMRTAARLLRRRVLSSGRSVTGQDRAPVTGRHRKRLGTAPASCCTIAHIAFDS